MTTSSFSFAVSQPSRLEVRIPSGDVRLAEGATGAIDITLNGSGRSLERITVDQIGNDTVRIDSEKRFGGGVDVVVTMPAGSLAEISVGSADVLVDVPLRELRVGAGSGDLRAGSVSRLAHVKTASGDINIDDVKGDLEVAVASGDVRIGAIGGDARLKSASGDITVAAVGGKLEGSTAAGDLTVQRFDGSDLRCTALSGDITIGIPEGRTLDVSLRTMTGDVINDLGAPSSERTGKASLRVKTMAGDIRLKPAR